jgi:O-antigen/teichoic acid export membrane protein
MLFMVSVPVAAGGTILANKILPLLYGDEFIPAVLAFQILIWAMPLISLHKLCSAMVTASHREKDQAMVRVLAALINLGLNLVIIPRFGLLGAAVITVLTELIIFSFMFRLVNDQFALQSVLHIIIKPLCATFLMGVAVFLGRDFNLFLVIGLGIIVYSLALLIIGAVDLRDPESLEAMLLRNIGQRLKVRGREAI